MKSIERGAAAKEPPSTRDRILTVALELFAQHGYAGASVRELARRVGIRESSLYNHFSNKAAILEHLAYIEALQSRDRRRIESACRKHLRSARNTLLRSLAK